MKHNMEMTQKDKEAYEKFKQQNPHLFDSSALSAEYNRQQAQIIRMKAEQPTDRDLLKDAKPIKQAFGKKVKIKPECIQREKAYWQHVANKPQPQQMDFKTALKMVHQIIKDQMDAQGRTFVLDASNQYVIMNLVKYFMGDKDGPFDPMKGLWMFGVMGTGKTFLMNVFSKFSRQTGNSKKFHMVSMEQITDDVDAYNTLDSIKKYNSKKKIWCLDDVGEEDHAAVYGKKVDVFPKILKQAYRDWKATGKTIMVTSNMAPDKIVKTLGKSGKGLLTFQKRYDERTIDRVVEMFNFVPLMGENKRRL